MCVSYAKKRLEEDTCTYMYIYYSTSQKNINTSTGRSRSFFLLIQYLLAVHPLQVREDERYFSHGRETVVSANGDAPLTKDTSLPAFIGGPLVAERE